MAIAFDTSASNQSGSASTLNITIAPAIGATLLLVTIVPSVSGSTQVTGVTYNGLPMTRINVFNDSLNYSNYVYGILNPTSGSHTVAISLDTSREVRAAATSYTGTNSTSLPSNSTTFTGGATSVSQSITTAKDNSWVWMSLTTAFDTVSAGANTVFRAAGDTGSVQANTFDSNAAIHPAGSATLNATYNTGSQGVILEIEAPAAAVANGNFFMAM